MPHAPCPMLHALKLHPASGVEFFIDLTQGISSEDIVLGFQAPEMRQYTGYAVV